MNAQNKSFRLALVPRPGGRRAAYLPPTRGRRRTDGPGWNWHPTSGLARQLIVVIECPLDGGAQWQRFDWERCSPLRSNGHLVAERIDKRSRYAYRQRCDETDPERGEPGAQDRHREDDSAAQAGNFGIELHHLAVTDDVRPADLVDVIARVIVQRSRKVGQDVANGDRLALRLNPARRGHDRKHFREVAQHLEGDRPGSDDHRST